MTGLDFIGLSCLVISLAIASPVVAAVLVVARADLLEMRQRERDLRRDSTSHASHRRSREG